MSFDDLQKAWENEKTVVEKWAVNQESAMQSATVLSRLRRNMRVEFFSQAGFYLLLLLIYIFIPKTPFSFIVVVAVSCILLTQGIYYYIRFYRFYRDTDRFDLSIIKNLRRIVVALELNIEIYKTYSICSAPVAIVAGLFIFAGPFCSQILSAWAMHGTWPESRLFVWIFLSLLVSFVVLIFFIGLHIRGQYGKQLAELKEVLNQTGE